MRPIEPGTAATGALEVRLSPQLPTIRRCLGVLDGSLGGVIWADDGDPPRWAIVTELSDGTTYIAGRPEVTDVTALFARLRPVSGEIVVGFEGPDDPVRDALPGGTFYEGTGIDFTDRRAPDGEAALLDAPPGRRVVELDTALVARTAWFADVVAAYGTLERWTTEGIGRALMRGDEILCEATAGPAIRGTMEIGIRTALEHRGHGYATLTCRHLVRACEARGLEPWWNRSADNVASVALARRLGFRGERPYDLVAWQVDRFR